MTDPNQRAPDLDSAAADALHRPDHDARALPSRLGLTLYDPSRDREEMRGKIAIWLVVSLLVLVYSALLITVATAVACSVKDSCSAETSSLASVRVVIEMLLSPLVGLVGAVAGFYFGEKSGKGSG